MAEGSAGQRTYRGAARRLLTVRGAKRRVSFGGSVSLVKSPKDFWIATIYIAIGMIALYVAADYRVGSGARMGPGYFPKVLAWALIGLGIVSLVRAMSVVGEPVGAVVYVPLLLAIAGLALFAVSGVAISTVIATAGGGSGAVFAALGLAALIAAVVRAEARPLMLVLLACGLFGWLLPRAGFIVALLALCLVSAAASKEFRFDAKATLGLAALVIFCAAVFVKGLGVPLPLWGAWLEPYVGGLPIWLR